MNDCVDLCLQSDFEYAGQYISHCICMNNLETLKDELILCDQMCSDSLLGCSKQLSVHLTGLKSKFQFLK